MAEIAERRHIEWDYRLGDVESPRSARPPLFPLPTRRKPSARSGPGARCAPAAAPARYARGVAGCGACVARVPGAGLALSVRQGGLAQPALSESAGRTTALAD
jgi:hypothetical protein